MLQLTQDITHDIPVHQLSKNSIAWIICRFFHRGKIVTLAVLDEKVSKALQEETEPFVLCGLSLGGVLALMALENNYPNLKGLVVSAPQYKAPSKVLLAIQSVVFKFAGNKMFTKMGLTKEQVSSLISSLSGLDLTKVLAENTLPMLILCGTKDKANLGTTRELAKLTPNSKLVEIVGGGHELNKEKPEEFARALVSFLKDCR